MPIAHAIRTVMQVRQLRMPDLLGPDRPPRPFHDLSAVER